MPMQYLIPWSGSSDVARQAKAFADFDGDENAGWSPDSGDGDGEGAGSTLDFLRGIFGDDS